MLVNLSRLTDKESPLTKQHPKQTSGNRCFLDRNNTFLFYLTYDVVKLKGRERC